MATTINSYSVSLAMDASSYIKNSNLSRKETAALTRDINQARNPAEKYERQVNRLDKALKSGAIDQATYNRLLEQAKAKLDKTSASTQKFVTQQSSLNSALSGAKANLMGMAKGFASLAAAQQLVSRTKQEFEVIDVLAKSSRALGENVNAVQRYQFALAELGGIGGEQAIDTLKKLQKSIGETALGVGRGKIAFEELNIDIGKLQKLSPVEQFEAIRDEISKVEDQTTKAALATKIFGEQGQLLLPILDASAEAYGISADQVDRLGLTLSDDKIARIEATNDAMGRLSASIQGLVRTGASLDRFAGTIDKLAGTLGPMADLGQFMSVGFNPIGDLIDAAQGKIDPQKLEAFTRLASEFGLIDAPAGKDSKRPRPSVTTDKPAASSSAGTITGLDDAMQSGLDSLGTSITGGFDYLGGVFGAVGGFIAQANENAGKMVAESQKDSPAIKSLEVGTQEAYSFLTDSINEQKKQEAAEAAKREQMVQNGKDLIEQGKKVYEAIMQNGFKRI